MTMTTYISTLALSPDSDGWDLTTAPTAASLSVLQPTLQNQDIALNTQGLAVAQDVASAIKLFQGELYYDTTLGVPYFGQVFSQQYNAAIINSLMQQAALTVPNVVEAVASVSNLDANGKPSRDIAGTVEILDVNGEASGVTL
jgi:hypothetical protein